VKKKNKKKKKNQSFCFGFHRIFACASFDLQEALSIGQYADVIVLALGIDKTIEHEGQDRTDTALPGLQEPFAQMVLALGKPVVLVLTNGGALAIDNLIDRPNAIVEAFNPCFGAYGLAHALFGFTNKWGKMPYTMYPHDYIQSQVRADHLTLHQRICFKLVFFFRFS
jgi:beta-D-xylosidase 4